MTGATVHSSIVKDEGFQYRFSVGNGFLRMFKVGEASGAIWWTGEFLHPSGIVIVYRQEGYTRLDLMAAGRCHSRGWQKSYGDRTITRLAREFIADMANAA
jgi:hypothetical protein